MDALPSATFFLTAVGTARAEYGESYLRYYGTGVHLPLPSARQCLAYQMESITRCFNSDGASTTRRTMNLLGDIDDAKNNRTDRPT